MIQKQITLFAILLAIGFTIIDNLDLNNNDFSAKNVVDNGGVAKAAVDNSGDKGAKGGVDNTDQRESWTQTDLRPESQEPKFGSTATSTPPTSLF